MFFSTSEQWSLVRENVLRKIVFVSFFLDPIVFRPCVFRQSNPETRVNIECHSFQLPELIRTDTNMVKRKVVCTLHNALRPGLHVRLIRLALNRTLQSKDGCCSAGLSHAKQHWMGLARMGEKNIHEALRLVGT